mgnify:CR=1 FL=1
MGWCAGTDVQAETPMALQGTGAGRGRGAGRRAGRGGGAGRGQGAGWRHRNVYYATGLPGWQRTRMGWPGADLGPAPSRDEEIGELREQIARLGKTIAELNSRLQEMANPAQTDSGEVKP